MGSYWEILAAKELAVELSCDDGSVLHSALLNPVASSCLGC